MKDPLDMVEREYLPWVRALAYFRLREMGYSQSKIARALGVTQPSVALYAQRQKKYCLTMTGQLGVPRALVEAQVERTVDASLRSDTGASQATLDVAAEVLGSGSLCSYHRAVAGLPETCDVCLKFFHTGTAVERSSLLRELEGAVRLLESSPSFGLLIPGVLTNFVSAMPGARDVGDVAGIAGRMAVVKGKPRAASPPEFGASRYTARVLLAVSSAFREVHSGLNIRHDALVDEAASGLGWRRLDLGAEALNGVGGGHYSAIPRYARAQRSPPDLLVESGGLGLEPSAYILGTDPRDVVEKALTLSAAYSRKIRTP